MSRRASALLVTVIAGLGAILRFWSIGAGAPWRMGVDEPFVLSHAVQILKSGDFNPHFFDYGGLTIYLHAAVGAVRFILGARDALWRSLDAFWMGDVLVYSRAVTAFIGALTIVVVYRAALRWGRPAAVVAAFAMAVQPYHVRESHFVLTDVPLTFCVALAWLLALRASERLTARSFFVAGLACGAAAAVKYPGLVALLLPLSASFALPAWRTRFQTAGLAIAGAAVGFLAGAPYSLLDLPGFLNGLANLFTGYVQPRTVWDAAYTYVKYLRSSFSWPGVIGLDVGWVGLLVAGAGLIAVLREAVREPARRPAAAIALIFPLYFFYFISDLGSLQFARYLLPLTPALSLFFALGVLAIGRRLAALRPSWAPFAGPVVAFLLLVPPLGTSISADREQSRTSTTDQAAQWLAANAKRDEGILAEPRIVLPPWMTIEAEIRLVDKTPEECHAATYLVLQTERAAYAREPDRVRYDALVADTEPVVAFPPAGEHPGPLIQIRRPVR